MIKNKYNIEKKNEKKNIKQIMVKNNQILISIKIILFNYKFDDFL
jgi:hypothetical protein